MRVEIREEMKKKGGTGAKRQQRKTVRKKIM
jgi:hypothetical protein